MTDKPRNPRRRRFLTAATAAASGSIISCRGAKSAWRFFSEEEAATAAAVSECLIPTDEFPGAAWAGVVNFMDRQLKGHYRRHQKTYRDGLRGVNQTSEALFGAGFVRLEPNQQAAVLEALEKGEPPGEIWKNMSSRSFVDLVLTHTMQGYYGDPRHGGNRDAMSWRMLGIPLSPIRGREQYDLRSDRQGAGA